MWYFDFVFKYALVIWLGLYEVSSICIDIWYLFFMLKIFRNFCVCLVNNLLWLLGDYVSERVGFEVVVGI